MPIGERKIAFIGGGNMARSLIGGLIAAGVEPSMIVVSDPDPAQLELIGHRFPVRASSDNDAAASDADIVVLAVKPQLIAGVCTTLGPVVRATAPLLISIAAGIRIADLLRWLGSSELAMVRTMPNTPALVQCGATALHAGRSVNDGQRQLAENVMRAVGLTLWVEREEQLDLVTALSGSGPAYFFRVIELLEEAAIAQGLPAASARLLTTQTAFGAAKMALESDEDAASLRQRVTSPGGTTERALGILNQGNIAGLFEEALRGARERASELADEFGEQQ